MPYDMIIAGVGGHGVIFMSKTIAEAAGMEGKEVQMVSHKGHSKREGPVDVHIRVGKSYSPLINPGEAELVVGLEPLEALRHAHFAKDGATFVVEKTRVIPVSCSLGESEYPRDIEDRIRDVAGKACFIGAFDESKKIGSRNFNVIMLGAASAVDGFPISRDNLRKALSKKGAELAEAFDRGIDLMVKSK